MRAELANLNHYAVLFLCRAAVNLCWYDSNSRTEVESKELIGKAAFCENCFMLSLPTNQNTELEILGNQSNCRIKDFSYG